MRREMSVNIYIRVCVNMRLGSSLGLGFRGLRRRGLRAGTATRRGFRASGGRGIKPNGVVGVRALRYERCRFGSFFVYPNGTFGVIEIKRRN